MAGHDCACAQLASTQSSTAEDLERMANTKHGIHCRVAVIGGGLLGIRIAGMVFKICDCFCLIGLISMV